MTERQWSDLIYVYADACQIGYYAARADVFERRETNGDLESARWFSRFLKGDKIAWSDIA